MPEVPEPLEIGLLKKAIQEVDEECYALIGDLSAGRDHRTPSMWARLVREALDHCNLLVHLRSRLEAADNG